MSEGEVAPDVLSDAESNAVLEAVILPAATAGAARQEQPVAVLVVGVPGAGKTTTADIVKAVLDRRGGAVRICSDLYKTAHPRYGRHLVDDPRTAGVKVRFDVRRWQAAVEERACRERFDVVVETVDPGQALAFREAGYRVELLVVVASEADSSLGRLERYTAALHTGPEGAGGRFVSWENADGAGDRLPRALARVEAERLADLVTVVRRGLVPVYVNELLPGGVWRRPPGADQAVLDELARPWSAGETARFRRALATAERRLHHERVSEPHRLVALRDAGRCAALAEPVRRIAQPTASAPGVDYHRLSADEHDWVFEELIVPGYLDQVTSQDRPVVVCVMGQPGTYKTWIANLVQRTLRRQAARIAGDVFKAFHPDYHRLLHEDPRRAGTAIRADYQAWQSRAEAYVRDRRADAVVEMAPGSPGEFLSRARAWRGAGYRVELVAIASRAADSRQATARRYAAQQREGLPARFTTAAGHDRCYSAATETLWQAELEGAADLITVVRRDASLLYRGRSCLRPGAALAQELERNRPYTAPEAHQFWTWQRELHAALPQHRAELERIAALARPLMPTLLRRLTVPTPAIALPMAPAA
ncbi:zeta toxin family protein [Kitasatospora sp. NPDC101155]|uniref:zeta toxin family protein n=1 Tax=Kitasatospora sp. NPDC101155 TaxID=3364097 RepID=UPI0038257E02